MRIFAGFLVVVFLLLGATGGYLYWQRGQKIEESGLRIIRSGEPMSEEKIEQLTRAYNQILDEDEVLLTVVRAHDLGSYYDLNNQDEIVTRFREDTFFKIANQRYLDILFRGQRKTRKEREAIVTALVESFRVRLSSSGL